MTEAQKLAWEFEILRAELRGASASIALDMKTQANEDAAQLESHREDVRVYWRRHLSSLEFDGQPSRYAPRGIPDEIWAKHFHAWAPVVTPTPAKKSFFSRLFRS